MKQELAIVMNRVGPVIAIGKPAESLTQLGARRQISDHQLRSGTPAGLIIIISELSNIGQTLSCIPDYLDQTILETRDPSEFRRIKFSCGTIAGTGENI